jgi:Carboxypeptidase regulatory-like domain
MFRKHLEPAAGFQNFRHSFVSTGHYIFMWRSIFLLALACSLAIAPAARASAQSSSSSKSHTRDFLIFATVFTDRGFALPGARVRVRRSEEKKFRWEGMSDSRGELGIRVKQGAEYELTVEARGFKPQTRKIDATENNRQDLTIQMEQLAGGKS